MGQAQHLIDTLEDTIGLYSITPPMGKKDGANLSRAPLSMGLSRTVEAASVISMSLYSIIPVGNS